MRNTVIKTVLVIGTLVSASACGGGEGTSSVPEDCRPAHSFPTVEKGKLTVATYDLPPYTKVKGKTLEGVDGDILKEIAAMECLDLKIKAVGAAASIPTAQAGRADLAAGDWNRTVERAKVVLLPGPVYTDQMGIVSKDGTSAIPALRGQTVGTVDGYLWVSELKDYLGGSLKVYSSALNMYRDLKSGRIDAAVDAFGSAVYNAEGFKTEVTEPFNPVPASLESAQSTYPLPKGSTELAKAIDEDVAKLRESGRIEEILVKHGLPASAADTGEPRLIG